MPVNFLSINDILVPQITVIEKEFLLVYKPPFMHSAPLGKSGPETMSEWVCREFPELAGLSGRKTGECGLLHRLDYETSGLLLIARSGTGMEKLLAQQAENKMLKEYSALCGMTKSSIPGFPPVPSLKDHLCLPRIISSFRPYGAGRKSVRPLFGGRISYLTEILKIKKFSNGINSLSIRITKGFRHQIRCHLSWVGFPILNDSLYGGQSFGKGLLGLRANSISFTDPATGRDLCYAIPKIKPEDI